MSHPDRHGPPDARLQLLVAEYTWVAGLVRYYREVELKALAGTGLVLSGVGAAFAALRAADSPDADAAIGVVLAIGAAITAFVLPVVLMASMRGLRAVVYVREWLHPLAAELAQDARFLAWETVAGELYAGLAGRFGRHVGPLLSSAVVVLLVGGASLALVAAAWIVEASAWSRAIAGRGGGVRSAVHRRRVPPRAPRRPPPEPAPGAARRARGERGGAGASRPARGPLGSPACPARARSTASRSPTTSRARGPRWCCCTAGRATGATTAALAPRLARSAR